jgi:peptidyl-prolyl cis-trans isomerase SurA
VAQWTQKESKDKGETKMAQLVKIRGGKIILIGLSLLFLLLGAVSSTEAIVDRVVAIVNQEIITLSEVEKWAAPLKGEIRTEDRLERRERLQAVSRKILDQLIEEKLIDQEVKRSGVKIPSKEVDTAVEEVRRKSGLTQEAFEAALASEDLTMDSYRQQIEKRLLRQKVMNWFLKVDSKAGDKELKDFYQQNIERYRINESYRPGHILFMIPKGATEEEIREIRKKSLKVLERIKNGEDFGEMALLYSQDMSAKDRGDLGFFKKGEILPAIEKEALRLRVGEVGGIIRTDYGFHIIKLLDRKGGKAPSFEDIKEKIQEDYYDRETEKSYKQFISTLKDKAVIEIKL